jgi:hypothetical protein
MLFWVVAAVVNAEYDRDVFTGGRCGDDDFLCAPTVDVDASLLGVGEEAGGFDDDVDAEIAPRKSSRIAFAKDPNALAVDLERTFLRRYVPDVRPIVAVVFEEMRALPRVDQIVDRRNLDLRVAFDDRLGEVSSNSAEAVDPNAQERVYLAAFALPCTLRREWARRLSAPSLPLAVGFAIGGLQRRPSSARDSSGCSNRSSAISRSAGESRGSP